MLDLAGGDSVTFYDRYCAICFCTIWALIQGWFAWRSLNLLRQARPRDETIGNPEFTSIFGKAYTVAETQTGGMVTSSGRVLNYATGAAGKALAKATEITVDVTKRNRSVKHLAAKGRAAESPAP